MFKTWFKRKLLYFFISITLLSAIVFMPLVYSLSDHLSKTARVNANILVVEGWLRQYAIEMAYDEFKRSGYELIITTGLQSPEYYMMTMNGYLIFYPQRLNIIDNGIPIHKFEISAYSELGGENASRFNVFVNDSLINCFSAEKKKKQYEVNWEGKITDIDSIMVQFINDGTGDFGDRNLYIKEIILNENIYIPYQNFSEYDVSILDGKRRLANNYTSYAQLAKIRLLSLGVDSSIVIAVPGKGAKINRTLKSALAFRDWLKTSDIDVNGINIVSLGTHSRRTWMTYNNILSKKYNIGIISLPDNKSRGSRRYKVLKTLRETIGIFYYWFILLPY